MDSIDLHIVAELQKDGRISCQELADRTGISRPAAARRLHQILSDNVSVVGVVHPAVRGLSVLAHVSLEVDGRMDTVASRLAADPLIPFVTMTAGPMSMVAEIRTRDMAELHECLNRIRSIPEVAGTDTLTYSHLLLDVLRPANVLEPRIDPVDLDLIDLLQRDGRTSFTTLASALSISPGTARLRVIRLINEGILRIGVIRRRTPRSGQQPIGIGLRVRGPVSPVAEEIAAFPATYFLAAAVGRFDLIGTIDGPTREETFAVLDQIRALTAVRHLESWVHLKVVKEQYYDAARIGGSTDSPKTHPS